MAAENRRNMQRYSAGKLHDGSYCWEIRFWEDPGGLGKPKRAAWQAERMERKIQAAGGRVFIV